MERRSSNRIGVTYRHYLDKWYDSWNPKTQKGIGIKPEWFENDEDRPYVSLQIERIVKREDGMHAIGWGDISTRRLDRTYMRHAKGIARENKSVKWKFNVWGYAFDIPVQRIDSLLEFHGRLVSNGVDMRKRAFDPLESERQAGIRSSIERARKAYSLLSENAKSKYLMKSMPKDEESFDFSGGVQAFNAELAGLRFHVSFEPIDIVQRKSRAEIAFDDVGEFIASSPFKIRRTAIVFTEDPAFENAFGGDADLLGMVRSRTLALAPVASALNALRVETIHIHNVGQGNYCLGLDGVTSSPVAVFDIGFTKDEPHANYMDAIASIEALDNQGVAILSHWDLDHILGAVYAVPGLSGVWGRTWILPELKAGNSQSAKNFAMYLLSTNPRNVWFVPDATPAGPIFGEKIGNIELHQGDALPKEGCTKENVRGLIAYVRGNTRNCLIPGDCIFPCFQSAFNGIDDLIVPHHGCETTIRNVGFNPGAISFVCVGKNDYGHPEQTTMDGLMNYAEPITVYRFHHPMIDETACITVGPSPFVMPL